LSTEPGPLNSDQFAVLETALQNGHAAEDIFAAVQEVTIVAQNAIPGTTITQSDATQRLLHLATVGMLYEKGMLTGGKP
jgi:hypothetical protein